MNDVDTSRQFAAFLGVGALAAFANAASRFVFGWFVRFEVSVLLAFLVGLSTAFVMNRVWVFSRARQTAWHREAFRFLVVNLAGLGVTLVAAVVALRVLVAAGGEGALVEGAAHLVGLGSTAVTSYIAHRLWTFRE